MATSSKVYKYSGLADVVTHCHAPSSPLAEKKSICFRVDDPDPNFIGRCVELEALKNAISSSQKPHIVVVSGMGGIGKTQLVRKFISENRTSYTNVIWINAEKPQLIEEAFKTLANAELNLKTIDANGHDKDLKSIVELVFSKLSTTTTLIVYDNADEKEHVKSLLTITTAGNTPHVMITSRVQEWSHNINKINLKVWKADEALQYISMTLHKLYNTDDTDDNKNLLAEKLNNFPLALRQATAHINYQRAHIIFHIDDYIRQFDTNKMLDSTNCKVGALNTFEKTTFTTWRIAIAAIENFDSVGELAARIIRIIAFFDRHRISSEIFFHYQLSQETDYLAKIRLAIGLLTNWSLIDWHIASGIPQSKFHVHTLVQTVIKIDLQHNDQEKSALRDGLLIFSTLNEHLNIDSNHQHAIAVYISALKFEDLVRQFRKIPAKILDSLIAKGKYRPAVEFGGEILPHLTIIFGNDDPDLLSIKSGVARSLLKQGMGGDALRLFQEIFEKRKNIYGKNHPETLRTQNNIARSLRQLGEYNTALEILEEVYEKEKFFGLDHKEKLMTLHDLASLNAKLGKRTAALKLLIVAFEKEKTVFTENHSRTLGTQHSIAESYNHLGMYSEALLMYQEVLEKQKKILGENHPNTLNTQHNIADAYTNLNQHTEALKVFAEVFEKQKLIMGEDHPNTLTTQHNMANSYIHLKKHAEALKIFEQVFEKQKRILGENHPYTLITQENMGYLYTDMRKHTEALQMFQSIFAYKSILLGEDHPDTIDSKHNMGCLNIELGKHNEALHIFQEVFEKRKNILGEDHPDTLTTQHYIAQTHTNLEKYPEAIKRAQEVFNIIGEVHPDTDNMRCYSYSSCQEVFLKQNNILGADHLDRLSTQHYIAQTYKQTRSYDSALYIFKEVFEKRKNILGEGHPATLKTQYNIAQAYINLKKYSEALKILQEVFEKRRNILGEDHPDTLSSQEDIALLYLKNNLQ